ncbi:MAG: type II toxin-antitoxin system RelE/ParE family toxin [Agriterribacter sp.]
MEKKIVVTKRFRKDVHAIYEYLQKEFSTATGFKFLQKVEEKLDFIARHPEGGQISLKRTNVRSILLRLTIEFFTESKMIRFNFYPFLI